MTKKKNPPTWVAAKLSLRLPRTLMDDFKSECANRKLSHHGVCRDLVLAWVSVNKPGCIPGEYRDAIAKEVADMERLAFEHDQAEKAKLTSHQKRAKAFEKLKQEKKVQPSELALISKNPHDKSSGFMLD